MATVKLGYTPHGKQKEIHQACELSHPAFFITVCAGRQSGKSTAIESQVSKWSLNDAGSTTMVVSPSDGQVQKLYKGILTLFERGNLTRSSKGQAGQTQFVLVKDHRSFSGRMPAKK